MGKKQSEGSGLPSLVAIATGLQEAMRDLRKVKGEAEEFEIAYDQVRLALNRVVVEILRRHLSEVTVRLDPKQPQAWDDHKAVLEVDYGAAVIRIPVPQLRSADGEIAEKVKRRIAMITLFRRDYVQVDKWYGRELTPEELAVESEWVYLTTTNGYWAGPELWMYDEAWHETLGCGARICIPQEEYRLLKEGKETPRGRLYKLSAVLYKNLMGSRSVPDFWRQATQEQCVQALRMILGEEEIPWKYTSHSAANDYEFSFEGKVYSHKLLMARFSTLLVSQMFLNVDWTAAQFVYRHSVTADGGGGGYSAPYDDLLQVYVRGRLMLSVGLDLHNRSSASARLAATIRAVGGKPVDLGHDAWTGAGYDAKWTEVTKYQLLVLIQAGMDESKKKKILSELK